jgi:hypothetical protein
LASCFPQELIRARLNQDEFKKLHQELQPPTTNCGAPFPGTCRRTAIEFFRQGVTGWNRYLWPGTDDSKSNSSLLLDPPKSFFHRQEPLNNQ